MSDQSNHETIGDHGDDTSGGTDDTLADDVRAQDVGDERGDDADTPGGTVVTEHESDEADMLARDRGANAEKTDANANFRADEDEQPPA